MFSTINGRLEFFNYQEVIVLQLLDSFCSLLLNFFEVVIICAKRWGYSTTFFTCLVKISPLMKV